MRPLPRVRSTFRTLFVATVAAATASIALSAPAHASTGVAAGDNRVTPGNFTGYGFDQCVTPTQSKMNAWMAESPFAAVGIYTSGYSRACRDQPNLTKSWVSKQLANRWRLLPITLGPQASCQPRFPRYRTDARINAASKNNYGKARRQGRQTAKEAVAAAQNLGITAGSTLWYDLEGFDLGNTACRESAIRFLSAWTNKIHQLDYVSGVYSSASSGIKMLDDARVNRPGQFSLPDAIWIARWDGVANTSTSYIREDGWQPHRRVKQYLGGHNERWGGVTINIDSNFLDVGNGSSMPRRGLSCGGKADLNLSSYPALTPKNATKHVAAVKALQCQLKRFKHYSGRINGKYTKATIKAANEYQAKVGTRVSTTWSKRQWVIMLSAGYHRVEKRGFTGSVVRRLQRGLTAATGWTVPITGVFDTRTERVAKIWQRKVDLADTGVMTLASWRKLRDGRYY